MLPDRVSNPGPLTYESGALPIALRSPAMIIVNIRCGTCYSLLEARRWHLRTKKSITLISC